MAQRDVYTDELVEPAADRFRRMDFRRRAHGIWREREAGNRGAELAADLGLASERLESLLSARHFGAAWASIERESPLLPRRRVRFADLPRQIELARQLLVPVDPADASQSLSVGADA